MAFQVTKWTEEAIRSAASEYEYYYEFMRECAGAIPRAKKLGIHDEVTSHMRIKQNRWDMESVRRVAAKFDVRNHFAREYAGAMKWAKRHGVYDEVCAHMSNNRRGDFDAVYLWKVKGFGDVYKVGVTSHRLNDKRIKFVSQMSGYDIEYYFVVKTSRACEVESEMLALGKAFNGIDCNGWSEFREFNPQELSKCLQLMGLEPLKECA